MSNTTLTAKEWMETNIDKYEDRQEFFSACEESVGTSKKTVQKIYKDTFMPNLHKRDTHIIEDNRNPSKDSLEVNELRMENAKLSRENQDIKDKKTFLENQLRSVVRSQNELAVFEETLIESVQKYAPAKPFPKLPAVINNEVPMGIVQISDLHLNEEVDIPGNKYNFKIAGQRLAKFSRLSRQTLRSNGVKRVVVAMTGDLLNSDRRADEYMNNTYNRTDAICVAAGLVKQFIESYTDDFTVTVCCVAGNESRVQQDWSWTEVLAKDNFDCMLFKMLSMFHADNPRISYLFGNTIEQALSINDQTIVITHGFKAGSNSESFASDIRSRFASKGILVDYVLYGHKHTAEIGDYYGRSGCLSGPNTYGEFALNRSCRASQNMYIVHKGSGIDGSKIDLQVGDKKGFRVDHPESVVDVNAMSNLDVSII